MDWGSVLARFDLSMYDQLSSMAHRPSPFPPGHFFLHFQSHDDPSSIRNACGRQFLYQVSTPPPSASSASRSSRNTSSICRAIERNQLDRHIVLTVSDVACTLPKKWFNSVDIDAFLNVRRVKALDAWYIVSAEDTPARSARIQEILLTPQCVPLVMMPLYRNYHWTFGVIDHREQQLYFFNSDASVDDDTADALMGPFQRAFPHYQFHGITCVRQDDNYSCGTYVCYWADRFFARRRDLLTAITPHDIRRFRTLVRQTLLLAYHICPRLHVDPMK